MIKISRQQLNESTEGIYERHSRIQVDYPVFIPNKSVLEEKLVEEAHSQTIHRWVALTMAKIKDQCWIPTLRQLVKRTIEKCYGCKKSTLVIIQNQQIEQDLPVSVTGPKFDGLFTYKTKGKRDIKVYLLLFICNHGVAVT